MGNALGMLTGDIIDSLGTDTPYPCRSPPPPSISTRPLHHARQHNPASLSPNAGHHQIDLDGEQQCLLYEEWISGGTSDIVSLVIALAAIKIVLMVAVKGFRGSNGEVERGKGVELVYVDVKRVDEGVDGNGDGQVCRRCRREEDERSDRHRFIPRHLDCWDQMVGFERSR